MPSAGNSPLDTPIDGLLATPTSRLPYRHNVPLRSCVLKRPQGNLIVLNSPGVSESADAIRAFGAPARLLVNHTHESMYGQPDLDVPVWVHAKDRPGPHGGDNFLSLGQRRAPLSVHRRLHLDRERRVQGGRPEPPASWRLPRQPRLVRGLDFDVLVPWGATEGGPSIELVTDRTERHNRIDAVMARVKAGGER